MGDTKVFEGGGGVMSARVGRVVVGVSGSLGNFAALHAAAGQARVHAVPLVALLAWRPVGGELAYRRAPCAPLLRLWREDAAGTLCAALVDAFGGSPHGVALRAFTVRGDAGPVLVAVAGRSDDLLVVGAGRRHLTRVCHGGVGRYCLAQARCCVLMVSPPELINEIRHGRSRLRGRDLARVGMLGGSAPLKRR
jgi:nucleotide-binding universal stress UspA family protein